MENQLIAFVGDPAVGKTSIIKYLKGLEFEEDYSPTEQIESTDVTIQNNETITIYDTPGNAAERKQVIEMLKNIHVVFVCFDVENIDSFDSTLQWLDDIKKQINNSMQVCLVACKIDSDNRQISQEQAFEFINDYPNVEYLEVSVKTGENMDMLIDKIPVTTPQGDGDLQQSYRTQQSNKQSEKPVHSPERQSQTYKSQTSLLNKEEPLWKVYDFLFPTGRVAKLVKISDVDAKNLSIQDILFKLQLNQSYPVVNLIGAKETNKGKFYAGIARACFNTDAVIVDSGISTGIEKYVIRRGVKLIGVAPEQEVKYPNQSTGFIDPYEISNGHTHIFLLNNKEKMMVFGLEGVFKINLCKKLAEGRLAKNGQRESLKVVHILLGEQEGFLNELQQAVMANHPIIVIKGSPLCDQYFQNYNNPHANYSNASFGQLVRKGHFYGLNSLDSEDIAQYVHFFLTVTPYN
ncbi:unnamed protein product [Paramecium octaurelia]|uniref:LSDAT prokaryote domain-containing protein n=1 Tax=Paramecium octaurelia TaxID=43137 RepID=A0A8S1SDV9_PAROT|nr:unnamed protein product [Paramecium octaurelia]